MLHRRVLCLTRKSDRPIPLIILTLGPVRSLKRGGGSVPEVDLGGEVEGSEEIEGDAGVEAVAVVADCGGWGGDGGVEGDGGDEGNGKEGL